MIQHRILRILGVALAVLFILLIVYRTQKFEPAPIAQVVESYTVVPLQPGGLSLSREESLPEKALLAPSDEAPVGLVVTISGQNAGDGILVFQRSGEEQNVGVRDGLIAPFPEVSQLVEVLSRTPSQVYFVHSTGSWSPVTEFESAEPGESFRVVLPEQRTLEFSVKDLLGQAVVGAQVAVYADLPLSSSARMYGKTDELGLASVTLFPHEPECQYRIQAPGYLHQTEIVNCAVSISINIKLRRILAAGVITDQRAPSIFHQLSLPSNLGSPQALASYHYRDILDQIEIKSELEESEEAFWLVRAEENEWLEISAMAAARDSERNMFGPISIPMLQITDPELRLIRPDLHTSRDHTAALDIHLVSSGPVSPEAWLSHIALSVVGTPVQSDVKLYPTYFGRLQRPGVYRLYLPPGTWIIETAHERRYLSGGSAPSIQKSSAVNLREGVNPMLELAMAPDRPLIEITFVGPSGIPVSIQGAVLPETASEVFPNEHGSRIYRFIELGVEYRLQASRLKPGSSSTLLDNLVLPEEAIASGRWRLTIPSRDPVLGGSHWLR